jgi:LPS-assembly protein
MLNLALAILLPLAQQPSGPELRIVCGATVAPTDDGNIFRCPTDLVVNYQDIRVDADWGEYDRAKNQVSGGDRVRFTRGAEVLEGGRLSYNFGTRTGTFANVKGRVEPGFFVTYAEARLLEDGTWEGKGIKVTPCEGECPGWVASFSDAVVEPGEKVTGTNAVFRFKGVPIFWAPKVVIPTTRRERSSGFLIPSTSNSTTKGRSVRTDFYWAINRSAEATFTSEYFSKRGPTGNISFRAIPGAATTVDVNTFFALDRYDQGGQRTQIRAQSEFGQGWRGVTDLDFTSNFVVRQIYEEGFSQISSPIEHSLGFLTKNRANSSINFIYDRSAIFYEHQPSIALRKFPAFDYSMPADTIVRKIPVYFSLDAGYAGVSRRDGQITSPSVMQRFDLRPSIHVPLVRTRALQWSHHLSVRDTLYTHSVQEQEVAQNALNRASVEYSTRLSGGQLERDFSTWRHIVEPSIEYRYIAGVDRYRQTIVVDDVDLMTDTNEIEYAITNRFMGQHEFLTWRIAQKLYFDPDFGGALLEGHRNGLAPLMDLTGFAFSDGTPRRFSPVVSTLRISTSPQTATDIQVDYDPKTEEFRSAGVMGELNRGQWFSSVAYFFNKRSGIQFANNQLRGMLRYGSQTKPGLSFGFSFYSDLSRSLLQGSTAQIGYNADCYGLSFDFSQYDLGARKETRFRFALSLKNLGSFGTLQPQERIF